MAPMPHASGFVSSGPELKEVDLCHRLNRLIRYPWELKQLPFAWLLVVYKDSGVRDHPLRQFSGSEDGKGAVKWFERDHEIAGFGATPQDAARSVISGGKGARLRARQIVGLEDRKFHLIFESLDTGQVIWPTQVGLVPLPRRC